MDVHCNDLPLDRCNLLVCRDDNPITTTYAEWLATPNARNLDVTRAS